MICQLLNGKEKNMNLNKNEITIRLTDKDALKFKKTENFYWKCPFLTINECEEAEPKIITPSGNELFIASYNIPCSNEGHSLWEFNTHINAKNQETWIYDASDEIIYPFSEYTIQI